MNRILGVVGSGVMGSGVAQVFAQAGYKTIVVDRSEEQMARTRDKIRSNIRFQKMMTGSAPTEKAGAVLERIQFTTSLDSLQPCSFIVENVTENWEIKREVYEQLNSICLPECIFGVNTSAISITRVASLVQRPERVVGIHFMNPVPLKSMVEVIRGYHTSEETLSVTRQVLGSLGKELVIVNDSVGFVTNRAMMIFVNEAVFMLQEQVASAEDIDILFKQCFGHKMGPLQTADLIGLDTILKSLEVLYDGFNDSKYRPCPLLKQMVDAGLHGMKSGQGFYSYI
ncbi:3-hydroxybutyryl-CoA dehydrogenase [Paenibacillus donghaensis]|uniref:3-hydroxyacyl-CoA dehydrogenase family protein n=1 Tax=Paenibacillus donghaensis TaxID=414771 RepID=UPI00188483EB|nr:3-hydroxyacyl-CoA dehydrogenase NAD-binding domain-containing protein [Paenibacillus donghaensis]MBE9913472.1 3-hydroxybutyryl-CoA dehydrogenase [Paenibacillus donghaensis]